MATKYLRQQNIAGDKNIRVHKISLATKYRRRQKYRQRQNIASD
jgi:rRNA maturation endonuclease Nob1